MNIEILGIDKKANISEIKKAYFTLAKKYHPDINKSPNAKEKFTEISEAYDTLSNDQKRKAYDENKQSSYQPFTNYSYYHDNFININSSFFKDLFDLFTTGSTSSSTYNNHHFGKDIIIPLNISFTDAIFGCTKQISYSKLSLCKTCNGSKCKPGTSPSLCSYCKGNGNIKFRRMFMYYEIHCSNCNGSGYIINDKCSSCKANGIINEISTTSINVPKGVDNGMNLHIKHQGNYSLYTKSYGDLYIKLNVSEDNYFRRNGYDIYTDNYIDISTAVLGGSIQVRTIYGDVNVNIKAGTCDGEYIDIGNYGVEKRKMFTYGKGKHYVRVKIRIPDINTMPLHVRKLYEEIKQFEYNERKYKH